MRIIGLITLIVLGLVLLLALAVGARSIPDIRRYLKIRAM